MTFSHLLSRLDLFALPLFHTLSHTCFVSSCLCRDLCIPDKWTCRNFSQRKSKVCVNARIIVNKKCKMSWFSSSSLSELIFLALYFGSILEQNSLFNFSFLSPWPLWTHTVQIINSFSGCFLFFVPPPPPPKKHIYHVILCPLQIFV